MNNKAALTAENSQTPWPCDSAKRWKFSNVFFIHRVSLESLLLVLHSLLKSAKLELPLVCRADVQEKPFELLVSYWAESRGRSLNPSAYFIKPLIVILYLILIRNCRHPTV